MYIGELCRYLLNQPKHPLERQHRLRIVGGNGLRPDIWEEFQQRFQIPLIREYYGATEGNNMSVNLTGRPGMVGRLQMGSALIRCDAETGEPYRSADGRCERVKVGETGLFVAKINAAIPFDGYADKSATQKKILEHVFKQGDRYFDSGDLLVLHEDKWLSFADRVGDTFRWKGENVSTNEVAEILNGAPSVLENERLRSTDPRNRWPRRNGKYQPQAGVFDRRVRPLLQREPGELPAAGLRAPAERNAAYRHLEAPESRLPPGGL